METLEDKLDKVLREAIIKTKEQIFKDFCNATTKEKQEEARLMANTLAKLTPKLKSNYNKG